MTVRQAGAGHHARRRSVMCVLAGLAVLGATACSSAAAGTATQASTRPASSASSSVNLTSGPLPAFLPTETITPDSMLTGTALRPAVTTEGDVVEAHTAAGSVRIRILGPSVPGAGLPYQTPADTCTWKVTLQDASTSFPLRASQFTAVDERGRTYHPRFVDEGHAHAPLERLGPGQRVTFFLRVVMPTGAGVIRWAPTNDQIVAAWDFVVEND